MIFIQVVLGVAWCVSGMVVPVASCVACGEFNSEDLFAIPVCALFGPMAFAIGVHAYLTSVQGRKR
jgi:hypothetical protein